MLSGYTGKSAQFTRRYRMIVQGIHSGIFVSIMKAIFQFFAFIFLSSMAGRKLVHP
jgi:hypothetical protein